MSEYIKVTTLSALREGQGRSFTVDGRDLAVFLLEGQVYAVENLCPHQHIPVLAEGQLEGFVLTCPMHGWQFDLVTGRSVNGSSRLTQFEVRIEAEDVLVALPSGEEASWW
ncbi:MAG: Rieske 2Fe-2S domain-containing protein [Bacteroidetes bacterium]|nr:Rieske 2Fe-2S domain-containing protein [Bacteroidota bacterium]